MKEILDPSSQPADLAALPLPEAYRAITLHRDEERMFDGIPGNDRDPRSLHLDEVPVPGEWSSALREVFGEYRAPTGVGSAPVPSPGGWNPGRPGRPSQSRDENDYRDHRTRPACRRDGSAAPAPFLPGRAW